ncbi:MAG: hypothetical protein U1E60_25525 [Reyranellaceae bacterium]
MAGAQRPLGAECLQCLHRGLISREQLGTRVESPEDGAPLPLRCTNCGGNRVKLHVFQAERQVRRFMAEYR